MRQTSRFGFLALLLQLPLLAWSSSSSAPLRAADAEHLLELAESQFAAARSDEAAASYREALLKIRERLSGLDARRAAEVDLALRRLAYLARINADAARSLEVFVAWAEPAPDVDPLISDRARYYAGIASIRATGDLDPARELWKPLGFLKRWRVIGSFDNERGGGFDTAYGPEKEIDLEGAYEGKKRRVSWRRLPARPMAGRVDLDALFLPNDECLAYALTFVRASETRDAALRFSSDEGVKLWVNGQLVASDDIHRTQRFDQAAVGIRLREGWNSILLKVAEGEGSWGFQARLTLADGRPIPGVDEGEPGSEELGTLREEFAPGGAPRKETSAASVTCHVGVESLLREAIAEEPADARLHYLLGNLILERNAHDSTTRPDTDLLSRAIELDGRPGVYHYDLALSLEQQERIAADRDDNAWRDAMLEAARRSNALAAYRLARYYLDSFSNFTRAEQFIEKTLEIHPHMPAALLLRGRLEQQLEFPLARRRAVLAAERQSPGSPLVLAARAKLLDAEDRAAERERILRGLLERNHLASSVRWQLADALLDQGKTTEAAELAAAHSRLHPFNTAGRERLAAIALGQDAPEQAAEHLARALEIRPEDHRILEKQGSAYLESGRRQDALRAWDRALELQPNLPELRERLEFLRSSRPRFEDEFRRDLSAPIAEAVKDPPDAGAGEAARVLLDLRAVRVNRDGTTREFVQTAIQVLNDRGVRMFDSYRTFFAAGEQFLEFKKARVTRRDGTVADARLSRHGGTSGASGAYRSASVDLPPLSPGDVLEVQFLREDVVQSFFGDYFSRRERFRSQLAIDEKVFILRAPADRKLYFHQRNLDLEPRQEVDSAANRITYTWVLEDIPRVDPEPGMPPDKEIFPILEISTFESWERFSHWYYNLISKQSESSPEIIAKVRELTSGKDSELDRIRAIYNFIVQEIRYNAWEFGVHGFKPYSAPTVFARRFGDCKDKATLATVMLEKLGIASQPVLIRADTARGEEDLALPMVHHFNHCITHVPAGPGRPALFFDGTATFHSLEELPSMDRGARVLVVREKGATLETIPWNSPADLSVDEEWTVEVAAPDSARVHIRLRARGDYAVAVRERFEIPAQRVASLEKIYGKRFAGAAVRSQSFSDLENLDENVSMSVILEVPRFVLPSSEGPSISLPEDFFLSSEYLGTLSGLEKRRFDVLLGNPRRSRLRAIYRLPAEMAVQSLPRQREIDHRFGRFRFSVTEEDGRLVLERLVEITSSRVSVADYSRLRDFAASIDQLRNEKIVLRRRSG